MLDSFAFKRGLKPATTCFFILALWGCRASSPSVNPNPTFTSDIAPITLKNCAPCHRPGEAGPFPLLTYEDVLKKAKTIQMVTKSRYMPPWPADPSYSHFLNERVLTDAEIALISTWVDNGSPMGDPNNMPPLPEFPKESKLGKPDLVVKMLEPVKLPGNNTD